MIPPTRNIGTGTTDLSVTDNILNIDTTLGAAIINLPKISTWFELKNKSGGIYDPDGLRWTDIGGHVATNNITFVAASGDLINGSASLVISTNNASGIITPTIDGDGNNNNAWEASGSGSVTGTGEYDVFGAVWIDNIFVESLDLIGLIGIYSPNYDERQGVAINIGGESTIVETVNMPDLIQVYGDIILDTNDLLTSFVCPLLTLVTGTIGISNSELLETISFPALTYVKGNSETSIYIDGTAISSLNLSALTTVDESAGIIINSNNSLTSIMFNTSLNCGFYSLQNNALIQSNVDDILENIDASGIIRAIISYNNLVGSFEVGETITGGTSAATGVISSDYLNSLTLNDVVGTFEVGETITGGTSGATSEVTSLTMSFLLLDGGTNATPSASGLTAKASLIAKGWNVATN